MTTEELKTKLQGVYDAAFNGRDLNALDELFSPIVADRSVAKTEDQVGLDGFKQRIAIHHAGVSDLRMEIQEMVVEGDLVAFRWSFIGTHDGPWIVGPATNKAFTLVGMNLERFEDGRIVEHFSYPNIFGLLKQLGLA